MHFISISANEHIFSSRHRKILFKCRNYISQREILIDGSETLIRKSSQVICHCYDNKMHGVAWARVHSISFPADRNVNFNSMDKLQKFWTEFEKEIEFWKCSFKLLNAVLIKKANLWQY